MSATSPGMRGAGRARSKDPFGEFIHDALLGFGVDDRWVAPVDGLPTPVTLCEIFPPDDFRCTSTASRRRPIFEISRDELDLGAIRAAQSLLVSVTGLSPGAVTRSATLRPACTGPSEAVMSALREAGE